SVARLTRSDYYTGGANRLSVHGKDATVTRERALVRVGRALQLKTAGQLEITARLGGTNENSTGGENRIGSETWRPNLDGSRVEAGAGLIWQPLPAEQIHFDYDFATGKNYEKPWSLSLGIRHQF
ncbi:MAG: autotransporter outer membrane beta-barrel domain-containing protein, partial [Opitutaceae bacterium]|nr:autotransporter outer membrane beta-barrel domain-containing protein [Opitutaceae bacterium]